MTKSNSRDRIPSIETEFSLRYRRWRLGGALPYMDCIALCGATAPTAAVGQQITPRLLTSAQLKLGQHIGSGDVSSHDWPSAMHCEGNGLSTADLRGVMSDCQASSADCWIAAVFTCRGVGGDGMRGGFQIKQQRGWAVVGAVEWDRPSQGWSRRWQVRGR